MRLFAVCAVVSDGVRLRAEPNLVPGMTLMPMLRYMDNVALVRVAFLEARVFARGSSVRRGTFIEDTFGKHDMMQARTMLRRGARGVAHTARRSMHSRRGARSRRTPRGARLELHAAS